MGISLHLCVFQMRKIPRTPYNFKNNREKRSFENDFQKNAFLQSYNPTNVFFFKLLLLSIYLIISMLCVFLRFCGFVGNAVGL